MGDPQLWRESIRALEFMIPECDQNVNCLVHDANIPFPEKLKEQSFHLIVLGPTFLCSRYNKKILDRIYQDYSFVRESNACKIALPQDDYDSSAILDEWLASWGIDRVYSVLSEHLDVLYPNYLTQGGEIAQGYTGYISDEWIDAWDSPKPYNLRKIDVSYRTHDAEKNLCQLRNLKYSIAHRFVKALKKTNANIKTDISSSSKDLIPGKDWHHFVEDSRFCLATPSGSSLLDPYGYIRQRIRTYCDVYPDADYALVSKSVIREVPDRFRFTAISPRNLEAALAETVQIATPSHYSGLMLPGEHYISLDENCENIADVLEQMSDISHIESIRKRTKELFLSEPRLRRDHIVSEIIDFAKSTISSRPIPHTDQEKRSSLINKHEIRQARYWKNYRRIIKAKSLIRRGLSTFQHS